METPWRTRDVARHSGSFPRNHFFDVALREILSLCLLWTVIFVDSRRRSGFVEVTAVKQRTSTCDSAILLVYFRGVIFIVVSAFYMRDFGEFVISIGSSLSTFRSSFTVSSRRRFVSPAIRSCFHPLSLSLFLLKSVTLDHINDIKYQGVDVSA